MSERGKQLFGEAVELPPEARASFLAAACGDDPTLQRELVALLRAHDAAGDFLAHPAELVAAAAADVDDEHDDASPPANTSATTNCSSRSGAAGPAPCGARASCSRSCATWR